MGVNPGVVTLSPDNANPELEPYRLAVAVTVAPVPDTVARTENGFN